MSKKTIEIFRAGTHVGIDGKSYTFTPDDVRGIADRYDPMLFSAPAVVGHPKHDDPAYGWADSLHLRDDGVLCADLDKIDPAFAEAVTAERYKKVSAAFYPANHPNNPTPGAMYLRHIGFLGAAAPGVAGLAPVAFADSDTDFIAFATDEELRPIVWLARSVGRMFRRMRDQLIEDKGLEEANKLLPDWEADAPSEIAAQLDQALQTDGPRFVEGGAAQLPAIADAAVAAAELASREAALAEREAALQQRELSFAEGERQDRAAEDAELLDRLVQEGRLPPGHLPQFAAFCERLAGGDMIAFSEGDEPQDLRVAFRDILSTGLGVVIRMDEVAGGDGLRFAEGQTVDQISAAIDAEMAAATAAGKPISAAEASRRAKSRT